MSNTLRLVVNQGFEQEVGARQARPSIEDMLSTAVESVVELETKALSENLVTTYKEIVKLLSDLPDEDQGWGLTTASFSIVLDAKGKASLFSAFGGEVRSECGITFVLARAVKD